MCISSTVVVDTQCCDFDQIPTVNSVNKRLVYYKISLVLTIVHKIGRHGFSADHFSPVMSVKC